MKSQNGLWLIDIAWRLDRLRWVPREVLDEIVLHQSTCLRPACAESPDRGETALSDRELAARLCAGCPVQDECLELELRTAGERTVGVWGGLTDDDRRAVHEHWLRRGDRADDAPTGGELE